MKGDKPNAGPQCDNTYSVALTTLKYRFIGGSAGRK